MEPIRITLLDARRSGKTCYLLAMFKKMCRGLMQSGCTLRMDSGEAQLSKLNNDWRKLINGGEKRWPIGTTETTKFSFSLIQATKRKIASFEWCDYRGGFLTEGAGFIGDGTDCGEYNLFRQIALRSTCLMICVSGDSFTNELSEDDIFKEAETQGLDRIVDLVSRMMEETDEFNREYPAIMIVVTQCDKYAPRPHMEVARDLKKMLPVFFAPDTNWMTMICPVTLGHELQNNDKNGKIAPWNVELPLLFSVYAELLKQIWRMEGESSIGLLC